MKNISSISEKYLADTNLLPSMVTDFQDAPFLKKGEAFTSDISFVSTSQIKDRDDPEYHPYRALSSIGTQQNNYAFQFGLITHYNGSHIIMSREPCGVYGDVLYNFFQSNLFLKKLFEYFVSISNHDRFHDISLGTEDDFCKGDIVKNVLQDIGIPQELREGYKGYEMLSLGYHYHVIQKVFSLYPDKLCALQKRLEAFFVLVEKKLGVETVDGNVFKDILNVSFYFMTRVLHISQIPPKVKSIIDTYKLGMVYDTYFTKESGSVEQTNIFELNKYIHVCHEYLSSKKGPLTKLKTVGTIGDNDFIPIQRQSIVDNSNEGQTKYLMRSVFPNYILKIIKCDINRAPIDEVMQDVEDRIVYFGDSLPETYLCTQEGGDEYHVLQELVSGELLRNLTISDLNLEQLVSLRSLLKKYLHYICETGKTIDLKGNNGFINRTSKSNTLLVTKMLNFLNMHVNVLTKASNPFESTNIMTNDKNGVYLVDVVNPMKSTPRGSVYPKLRKWYSIYQRGLFKAGLKYYILKLTLEIKRRYITHSTLPNDL